MQNCSAFDPKAALPTLLLQEGYPLPSINDNWAAERRMAHLAEQSAPGIWDWDVASGVFVVSPRLREIFGFTQGAAVSFDTLRTATHPADRDWAALGSSLPLFGGKSAPLRFRIERHDTGVTRWLAARNWVTLGARGEISGFSGTVEDVTDEMLTANALAESEERLRLAIEAGKMAVWEVDLQTGEMTQSPELNILCGFDLDKTVNIQDVRALYNPGEIERLAKEKNTVEAVGERAVGGAFEPWRPGALRSGSDRTQVQAEVAITTPAGVGKNLMLRAQYAVSAAGRPRLTGLLFDISEAKLAEERLAVVVRELQHRVKNLLAVIGAIAQQSLMNKPDGAEALDDFFGRLSALGAANDLILARDSAKADLLDLVGKITRPYCTPARNPFEVSGQSISLEANAATAVGMILHELCTNAVKYGSLSVDHGQVSLAWEREADGRLVLLWEERHGPVVEAPRRRGFGSRLIESMLKGELGGQVRVAFDPGGVKCRLELPARR